ncbi:MAG TPA: oligosaccharide flippase family protein [Candidatus Methanoperedens sp.]|nr:oligosaccharide flippase family protein [Candidatus Methanoperedens sp.]
MSLMRFRQRSVAAVAGANRGLAEVLGALGADSAQYLVGLAVVGLGNMVLIPLYSRRLSPAEFGVFGLLEVVMLASIAVAGLGLNLSYAKWHAEVEPAAIPRLLGTQLLVGLAAATAVGLAATMSLHTRLFGRHFGASVDQHALSLSVIIMAESVQGLLLNHLRAARKPALFTTGSIARLGAVLLATVWLMNGRGLGLSGLFWGRALGDAFGVAVLVFFCRSDISLKASREYAAGMLKLGFPLVWSALLVMLLDGSGRFFLGRYGDLQQVGTYSMGTKIAGLMKLVIVMPFGVAWGGLMFRIAKMPDARHIYSKLAGYVLVLSSALALMFSLTAPTLFQIFATRAYAAAMPVLPLLLLVQAITVLQYPLAIGLHLGGATRSLIPISLAGLVLTLLISWALVPQYGADGAAAAWLAGWGGITLLIALASQRKYPLNYELTPLALGVVMAGLTVATRWLMLSTIAHWHVLAQLLSASLVALLVCAYFIIDIRNETRPKGGE